MRSEQEQNIWLCPHFFPSYSFKGNTVKLRLAAAYFVFMGVTTGMTTHSIAAPSDDQAVVITIAQVPIPKLQKTIDLSGIRSLILINKMAFSPDGRYLAIVINTTTIAQTDIVVWDMKLDKEQSYIHCQGNYSVQSNDNLLWSMDGKSISFGAKRQWDSMTGESIPDNPAIGRAARLNKDGSKMLTIVTEADGKHGKHFIYIYDTRTWELQKIYGDGLIIESAAWTSDDKIMVGVVAGAMFGKVLDGHTINHYDVALRLIDPSGKEPIKALWFDSVPDERPHYSPWKRSTEVFLSVSNFASNQIALNAGQIINGKTMDILTYFTVENMENNSVSTGVGGMVFSPNGKYLFIKAGEWFDGRKPVVNSIIDTTTGKQLAQFGGGNNGIAISPNGQQLAIGNNTSVQILSLK